MTSDLTQRGGDKVARIESKGLAIRETSDQ